MAQSTALNTKSIRQADWQMLLFDALAAFANLGETPDEWGRFRLGWPDFFPGSAPQAQSSSIGLTDWLYKDAEDWAKFCYDFSASLPADYRLTTVPPLLWYRDLLRAVWTRQDVAGAALSLLVGFADQAQLNRLKDVVPRTVRATLPSVEYLGRDFDPKNALPSGRPAVDVGTIACTIRWEFGCQFQQAIYELMQNLWRAKVCPQCKRFFIAGKTAQKFCSTKCTGEKKASDSLDYYHREGRFRRQEQSSAKSVKP